MSASKALEFDRKALIQNVQAQAKIICMHAEGDYLYIGTNKAKVFMYRVKNERDDVLETNTVTATTSSEDQKLFTANVASIQTDPEYELLFLQFKDPSLGICVYDLQMNTLIAKIIDERTIANFMVIDKDLSNRRFALACDRKIVLYSYENPKYDKSNKKKTFRFEKLREIKVDAGPIYMDFIGRYIVSILKSNDTSYTIFRLKEDDKNPSHKDLAMPRNEMPSIGKWRHLPKIIHIEREIAYFRVGSELYKPCYVEGKEFKIKKKKSSDQGDKIDVDFYPSEFHVPLNSEVEDVALCFPYIAAVVGNSIQFCNVYGPQQKYVSTKRTSIEFTGGLTMICSHSDRIYVSTGSDVYALIPPPLRVQLASLAKDLTINVNAPEHLNERYSKGLSEDVKLDTKLEMRKQAGLFCLYRGQIKDAFRSFLKNRELSPDPKKRVDARDIIQCFLSQNDQPVDHFRKDSKIIPLRMKSDYEVDESFASFKPLDIAYGSAIISGDVQLNMNDIASIFPSISAPNLMSILIHKAMNGLLKFLEKLYLQDWTEEERDERFAVEFALVCLYLRRVETDPQAYAMIEKLVTNKRTTLVLKLKSVSELFYMFGCVRHVALLLNTAGIPEKALKTLRGHIGEELFVKKYDGVEDMINILKSIDGKQLIEKDCIENYVSWVINRNPKNAVEIFIAPRIVPPPIDGVLKILRLFPHHIKTQYLEHIITREGVQDEEYHTQYAVALIDNITKLYPKMLKISAREKILKIDQDTGYQTMENSKKALKVANLLSKMTLKTKAGDEPGLLGEYRKKLIQFLKTDVVYNRDIVIEHLEPTILHEEQVEVLKMMGRHQDALAILLFRLKDPLLAEEYCVEAFEQIKLLHLDDPAMNNSSKDMPYNPIFTILIKTWIKHDPELKNEDIKDSVVDLLNQRSLELDPITLMDVLPELPNKILVDCFSTIIQSVQHQLRTSKLQNQIAETANAFVVEKHFRATSRKVTITTTVPCPVCDQPISDSVFAVFPDDSVVHYKCLIRNNESERDKNIHPLRKLNFKNFPVDF